VTDRQEAAAGAVSAVNACHRETVLGTGYRCRPPGPLLPLQATVPRAVAAAAGGGRRRNVRQERTACRSSRESWSHEASGQACCQSARAIRSPEGADNPLAGARGHAARDLLAGAPRQADDCIQRGTIRRASQIPSNFGRLRPDDFTFC
jgi:hypothetical protein